MIMLEAMAAIVTISFEIIIAFAVLALKIHYDRIQEKALSKMPESEKEESIAISEVVSGDAFGTPPNDPWIDSMTNHDETDDFCQSLLRQVSMLLHVLIYI